jgi:hypothetical protein
MLSFLFPEVAGSKGECLQMCTSKMQEQELRGLPGHVWCTNALLLDTGVASDKRTLDSLVLVGLLDNRAVSSLSVTSKKNLPQQGDVGLLDNRAVSRVCSITLLV